MACRTRSVQLPLRRSSIELDQAVLLQRPQVVVDLLPGQPDAGCERAGRAGLGQLSEQPGPDRVQRSLGGGGVVDDGDVVHEIIL